MFRFCTIVALFAVSLSIGHTAPPDDLASTFRTPPDSARPGVYWYFMDGNLSRDGMTRDLESMKAAGIGRVLFLEVNVGVPAGPIKFLSNEWQDHFVHAVREADRLGMELTLGSGPGWAGSGGPWVKPEQSMQHLVGATVAVEGPGPFKAVLPVAPPFKPYFGLPASLKKSWSESYRDVAVLAFPTPTKAVPLTDLDEKALYVREPFSSKAGVPPRLPEPPADTPPDATAIPVKAVVDLTSRLKPDGTLDWNIPTGKWTVVRFVSRNNGLSTRPAPEPGMGFECDKFDTAALDSHLANYFDKLLAKVGPLRPGRGWTMLHIDSWEMSAQNWSRVLRDEFRKRRGYDPQPFYPAYLGYIVGDRATTERFLWDLRLTGSELVVENHGRHLRSVGKRHGLTLSIEPYDMHPGNDFDLGAVADVPMCEFWSAGYGFNTAFSVVQAASIAHVMGRPIVAAEAFTAGASEAWKQHPGSMKDQGDWAFAAGINRFFYHTFAHKPDETRPGMVMGPYGVHWDRGQTWWPLADAYHRYVSRCQQVLSQGRTVADILYVMPEGAPNVFQPPTSALTGTALLPDRRGYNFDGCSADALIRLASVTNGCVTFPGGASYRIVVLPNQQTMTPALVEKLATLVAGGATITGPAPVRSPSLAGYPKCDEVVAEKASTLWGTLTPPQVETNRAVGKGCIIWGGDGAALSPNTLLGAAQWIWFPEGNPAKTYPLGSVTFTREVVVSSSRRPVAARLVATADNTVEAKINGTPILSGDNFNLAYEGDALPALHDGTNTLEIVAANVQAPGPAGLIAALRLQYADGTAEIVPTDATWLVSRSPANNATNALVLGVAGMAPWQRKTNGPSELYPPYEKTAAWLAAQRVPEDFSTPGPLRYTHRTTPEHEIYFVSNHTASNVSTTATFRVTGRQPEWWDAMEGSRRALPEFTDNNGVTTLPLHLPPRGSGFVVFPKRSTIVPATRDNFPALTALGTLDLPWSVAFDPALAGPGTVRFETLTDWTTRSDPGVKHYSGLATYQTTFDLPATTTNSGPLYLDLGRVEVMARVRVNGVECGTVWTPPCRVDIRSAVKPSGNRLEIEVANLWPNRMIADAANPAQAVSRTTFRPYKSTAVLLPSGLLGPVSLQTTTP